MSIDPDTLAAPNRLSVHLLGQVSRLQVQALQWQLISELAGSGNRRAILLIAEHDPEITLGRSGSRLDVRLPTAELVSRQLEINYVTRSGGCLAHGPGQLAVYPLIPLFEFGWSIGEYCQRLQRGLAATLRELHLEPEAKPGRLGLWGRSGQVVFVGAAVRSRVTWQGAFVNVAPEMGVFRRLLTDNVDDTPAGSLNLERRGRVLMPSVRGALVRNLATAFDCADHHLFTGHPLLRDLSRSSRESARLAS